MMNLFLLISVALAIIAAAVIVLAVCAWVFGSDDAHWREEIDRQWRQARGLK